MSGFLRAVREIVTPRRLAFGLALTGCVMAGFQDASAQIAVQPYISSNATANKYMPQILKVLDKTSGPTKLVVLDDHEIKKAFDSQQRGRMVLNPEDIDRVSLMIRPVIRKAAFAQFGEEISSEVNEYLRTNPMFGALFADSWVDGMVVTTNLPDQPVSFVNVENADDIFAVAPKFKEQMDIQTGLKDIQHLLGDEYFEKYKILGLIHEAYHAKDKEAREYIRKAFANPDAVQNSMTDMLRFEANADLHSHKEMFNLLKGRDFIETHQAIRVMSLIRSGDSYYAGAVMANDGFSSQLDGNKKPQPVMTAEETDAAWCQFIIAVGIYEKEQHNPAETKKAFVRGAVGDIQQFMKLAREMRENGQFKANVRRVADISLKSWDHIEKLYKSAGMKIETLGPQFNSPRVPMGSLGNQSAQDLALRNT